VHLLLGHTDDPCCLNVSQVLQARGLPIRIIANPLAHPSHFSWRLTDGQSASGFAWGDEPPLRDDQIAGVFVRGAGWIEPDGWQADDLIYMQSETQAALLAWLWSLPCPVVNRYSAALWYRSNVSLLSWQPLLRRCGLPALETLVTNVESEARNFGERLALEGVTGAVYGPLTSDTRYLVSGEKDWSGLAALQRCSPVSLSYPHGPVQPVCVVGAHVVWEGTPSREMAGLTPAVRRFAAAAGLTFMEFALASTPRGVRVVAVEARPTLMGFSEAARWQIAERLADQLTAQASVARKSTAMRQRSLA